jgi:hypothetical protein
MKFSFWRFKKENFISAEGRAEAQRSQRKSEDGKKNSSELKKPDCGKEGGRV